MIVQIIVLNRSQLEIISLSLGSHNFSIVIILTCRNYIGTHSPSSESIMINGIYNVE